VIQMTIKFDDEILNTLERLPHTLQYKCIDPAARKMAKPIIARAEELGPDSSKQTPYAAAKGLPPSKERWLPSAKSKYDTGPSRLHVVSKYWKAMWGGILFIGMDASDSHLGRKMHFRLPVIKRQRRQIFWGRPAETYGQQYGPGKFPAYVQLEEPHFLQRALDERYGEALTIFKKEFYKNVEATNFG